MRILGIVALGVTLTGCAASKQEVVAELMFLKSTPGRKGNLLIPSPPPSVSTR
jgi:hypothetical protein